MGLDNFELQDILKPLVSDNDVLVRIKAAAFNPIDYQMRQGGTESKLLKSMILGREFAGVVESAGKLAEHISIGDAVVAYAGSLGSNGTYAGYISIPQELVAGFIDQILTLNKGLAFDYCIDLVGGKISEICSELVKVTGIYADVTNLATDLVVFPAFAFCQKVYEAGYYTGSGLV